MSPFRLAPLALLTLGLTAPASAARSEVETTTVHIGQASPASPAAVRRIERRVAEAALEVCGGSSFSLAEVKDAIRRSPCWQESYTAAIAQVNERFASGTDAPLSSSRTTGEP